MPSLYRRITAIIAGATGNVVIWSHDEMNPVLLGFLSSLAIIMALVTLAPNDPTPRG